MFGAFAGAGLNAISSRAVRALVAGEDRCLRGCDRCRRSGSRTRPRPTISVPGRSPRPSTRPATGPCGFCSSRWRSRRHSASSIIPASFWRGARWASHRRATRCLHLSLYVLDQHFDLFKVASEIVLRIYLLIGALALAGLIALASTSTDAAISRLGLGSAGTRLHRLVYGIAVLGAVHFFIQSKLNIYQPVLMAGFLVWLLAYRGLFRRNGEVTPLAPRASRRRRGRSDRGRRSADLHVHERRRRAARAAGPFRRRRGGAAGLVGACRRPCSRRARRLAAKARTSAREPHAGSRPAPCRGRPRSNPAADGGTRWPGAWCSDGCRAFPPRRLRQIDLAFEASGSATARRAPSWRAARRRDARRPSARTSSSAPDASIASKRASMRR